MRLPYLSNVTEADEALTNFSAGIINYVLDSIEFMSSFDFMGDGWSNWRFYAFGLCICTGVFILLWMRARSLRVSKVTPPTTAVPTVQLEHAANHVMERPDVDGCPCGHCSRLRLLATYKFMMPAQIRIGARANRA